MISIVSAMPCAMTCNNSTKAISFPVLLYSYVVLIVNIHTVKMNMLYLINRIVATDYKQYY